MKKSEQAFSKPSTGHRLITAAFGAFFTVVAIILYFVSERTIGPLLAALVLGFVGVNAIVSAYRNKPSLLSRIGPLP